MNIQSANSPPYAENRVCVSPSYVTDGINVDVVRNQVTLFLDGRWLNHRQKMKEFFVRVIQKRYFLNYAFFLIGVKNKKDIYVNGRHYEPNPKEIIEQC